MSEIIIQFKSNPIKTHNLINMMNEVLGNLQLNLWYCKHGERLTAVRQITSHIMYIM